MKKMLVLVLVLTSSAFAEQPLIRKSMDTVSEGTKMRPYYLLSSVCANDVPLDEKKRYWEYIKPSSGLFAIIDDTCNRLEFAFYVDGNTADKQYIDPNHIEFNFRIFAARRYSSAVIVCTGSAKCGELELSGMPTDTHSMNLYNAGSLSEDESHKWVSGLTVKGTKWPTPVVLTDAQESDNGIARINLDTNGYALWWCEITSIKGNPGRVTCVASGW